MKVSTLLLLLFAAPFRAHTHEQITLHAPLTTEKRVAIIGKLSGSFAFRIVCRT